MGELHRRPVSDQLGAADPAVCAPGVTIRVLDPAVQAYVSRGASDLAANTVRGGDPCLVWLAPDRALLVSWTALPLPDTFDFVSDMTDGLAMFEISGPRAGEIISAGCTLSPAGPDLAPGRCAQTVFGGVRVVLYASGTGDGFRIHVERPLAAFLLAWFRQAASALL